MSVLRKKAAFPIKAGGGNEAAISQAFDKRRSIYFKGAVNVQKIYAACFFMSGAAGLIYQIVWIRMFSLVFGATVFAVSMVVAAFLAGLALGSHFLGKWADRLEKPVAAYIWLEIAIAVSALAVSGSIYIFDDFITSMMTVESIGSFGWQITRFVLLFAILLIPTFLMGGTLPVMSKFYVKNIDGIGLGIGSLYAANTYGAMAGCFFAGYLLISQLGVWGALITAFWLNVAAALVVWAWPTEVIKEKKKTGKKKKKKKEALTASIPDESRFAVKIPLGLSLLLAGLAGFTALALEILWTRAFIVSFKSTVYLFSNLLTVYLLGLALGSHFFSKRLDRLKDPIKLFGFAQIGIGLWGFLSVLLFYKFPDLAAGLGAALKGMSLGKDVFITLGLMALGFLFPAFLFGLSYPLICRITTDSIDSLGRFAGLVYAVGTVGGIVGSLAAGFLFLPLLGLQTSLLFVSVVGMATGYVSLLSADSRKGTGWVFPASAVTAILIVTGIMISGIDIGLGGAKDRIVFSKEDIMGTVKVTQEQENGPLTLMVNNYQLATSGDVAVRFGHIPLLLKPDAKDVLLISFGSGITAGSVGRHPVKRIECVEIVPSLIDAQTLFAKDNHNIIADKRFHLSFWDGRHYVKMTKRKYDLVISDLFQPDSAGVGSLYSLEHFLNVKSKLKKGGAMAQWLPMYQLSPDNLKVIMRTFAYAFEHVLVWSGDINAQLPTLMLLGSTEPIGFKLDLLVKAFENEDVREDMIESADPLSFLSFFVMERQGVLEFTNGHKINTDNKPLIEYTAPRNIWDRAANAIENFNSLIQAREKINFTAPKSADNKKLIDAAEKYFKGRELLLKGKVDHALRNYPDELKKYKEAAKLTPTDPFLGLAVFDLGFVYFNRGDFKTATKIFEWAKLINSDLLEIHFYLAKAYQYQGLKKEALEAFKELERLNPEIAGALIKQK